MSLKPFSIRADEKTMEALGQIAASMDRSRNWVINDALKAYIEDRLWLEDQVAQSREEIAQGKGVSHERAMSRMRQRIQTPTP